MSSLAVERALILLRRLAQTQKGLSIREASRELGYSPASVQRIITAFKKQDFATQDELTERYHLGPAAIQLGLIISAGIELRETARPAMQILSRGSGETVLLGVSRTHNIQYIDKVLSTQDLRIDAPIGAERPFNCTAAGKVLLAEMPEDRFQQLADDGAFEQATENSITELDALRSELDNVRRQGWAHDNEEYRLSAACVAAPIRDHSGNVVAAVTVTGPASRVERELDRFVSQVKTCGASISSRLGFEAP